MSRRDHSPIPPPRVPKLDHPYPQGGPGPRERFPPPRRPRSPSPGYRRERSPPERWPKRHHIRGDDFFERRERYGSPPRGRGARDDPDYGPRREDDAYERRRHDGAAYFQPPPPPGRYDERGGGGGVRGGGGGVSSGCGPKSFKRFLLEDVDDGVSPAQAQALYEAYLCDHFGDSLRARFETDKADPEVRAAYHPAAFEASLAAHTAGAASAAALLALDLAAGKYDPRAPGFNQGRLDAAPEGQAGEAANAPRAPAPEGPPCLWAPERVAADYRTAKRLACLLDFQRGLQVADNPLLPPPSTPAGGADEDMRTGGEGGGEGSEGGEGGDGGEGGVAGDTDEARRAAAFRAAMAEIQAEEVAVGDEASLLATLGGLDQLLTWLWAVHGLDYYGGREALGAEAYAARLSSSRTVRGPRPEEGEEQDEHEAKRDRKDLAARVDATWAARLEQPDPLLQGCQRDEIEARLAAWIESQIKQESEKKWGSSFSAKFFLDKRFVLKHIHNKHGARLEQQRDAIRDELFWAAYEADRKAQHAAARAAAKQREAAAAAAAAADAGSWQEGAGDGEGGAAGGRPAGRLGPMRSRAGGRAGRGGRGMLAPGLVGGELPLLDPAALMGGLPGPIILPGPGMLGGAPGLPGLGAPLLLDPSMLAGPELGGMPLFIPAAGAGGRAMHGGRAGRGRGRARGPPPGPGSSYVDLDDPSRHARGGLLDYGDI